MANYPTTEKVKQLIQEALAQTQGNGQVNQGNQFTEEQRLALVNLLVHLPDWSDPDLLATRSWVGGYVGSTPPQFTDAQKNALVGLLDHLPVWTDQETIATRPWVQTYVDDGQQVQGGGGASQFTEAQKTALLELLDSLPPIQLTELLASQNWVRNLVDSTMLNVKEFTDDEREYLLQLIQHIPTWQENDSIATQQWVLQQATPGQEGNQQGGTATQFTDAQKSKLIQLLTHLPAWAGQETLATQPWVQTQVDNIQQGEQVAKQFTDDEHQQLVTLLDYIPALGDGIHFATQEWVEDYIPQVTNSGGSFTDKQTQSLIAFLDYLSQLASSDDGIATKKGVQIELATELANQPTSFTKEQAQRLIGWADQLKGIITAGDSVATRTWVQSIVPANGGNISQALLTDIQDLLQRVPDGDAIMATTEDVAQKQDQLQVERAIAGALCELLNLSPADRQNVASHQDGTNFDGVWPALQEYFAAVTHREAIEKLLARVPDGDAMMVTEDDIDAKQDGYQVLAKIAGVLFQVLDLSDAEGIRIQNLVQGTNFAPVFAALKEHVTSTYEHEALVELLSRVPNGVEQLATVGSTASTMTVRQVVNIITDAFLGMIPPLQPDQKAQIQSLLDQGDFSSLWIALGQYTENTLETQLLILTAVGVINYEEYPLPASGAAAITQFQVDKDFGAALVKLSSQIVNFNDMQSSISLALGTLKNLQTVPPEVDLSSYSTTQQMNAAITAAQPNLTQYSTTVQMNTAINAAKPDLTPYSTTAQMNTAINAAKPDLTPYSTTVQMNTAINAAKPDLTPYSTTQQTQNIINTKLQSYAPLDAFQGAVQNITDLLNWKLSVAQPVIDKVNNTPQVQDYHEYLQQNYLTTAQTNQKILETASTLVKAAELESMVSQYTASKDWVNNQLAGYQTTTAFNSVIGNYPTQSAVQQMFADFTASTLPGGTVADQAYVNSQIDLMKNAIQNGTAMLNYYTKSQTDSKYTTGAALGAYVLNATLTSNYSTTAAVTSLINAAKPDLTSYAKTSDLVGYQTTANADSKYATIQNLSSLTGTVNTNYNAMMDKVLVNWVYVGDPGATAANNTTAATNAGLSLGAYGGPNLTSCAVVSKNSSDTVQCFTQVSITWTVPASAPAGSTYYPFFLVSDLTYPTTDDGRATNYQPISLVKKSLTSTGCTFQIRDQLGVNLEGNHQNNALVYVLLVRNDR